MTMCASTLNTAAEIHVAVGVLRDSRGRFLLTQRRVDSHQGGLWEFPGGKVEAGETLTEALRRELREELGVTVLEHRALLEIRHDYGDKQVLLDVHEVLHYDGQPRALENQPMRWVASQSLDSYAFPEANAPIVEALRAK